ncbi:MAG: MBL fold metallo-hydrolase, partial [Pseudomonadota bacterium]
MKKVLVVLALIAALLAGAAAYVFDTASGQDTLFRIGIKRALSQTPETFDGLQVVVCGSASPLGNDPDRAQACIAVVTPEHFFLFDVGARSPLRIRQAQLPLARITGVFLTHYHSDHIASLPDVNLNSWVAGRPTALQVFGPEGVNTVVDGFNLAYTPDRGYRTAHHGAKLLPPATGVLEAHTITPNGVVWEDELLRVTAFPVEHRPIEPAVGYRVDYRGRSVVISGDTNATDTLFAAAEGADVLLHDALSRTLLDPMIETARELGVPVLPTIMSDVIDYHADTRTLPERAEAAGVRQLVLYHMVPIPPNAVAARMFLRDMPDGTVLAKDLHTFNLPPNST